MIKLLPVAVLLMGTGVFSQGFVNGSFESTTSTGCDYNNAIAAFNSKMDNVQMYAGGETDIQEDGCYITMIPDGSKVVGIAASDAINIELTTPLVAGSDYELTFWKYGNTSFGELGSCWLGASEDGGAEGVEIGVVASDASDTWEERSLIFTAPNNATHISIRNEAEGSWNQIDLFDITLACAPLTVTVSSEEVCFGDTVTLSATALSGSPVSWDMGIEDGVAFVPEVGTTTFTATTADPEDCSYSVDILVHALPEVTASVDMDEICIGDSVIFTEGGADSYVWDPADLVAGELYGPTVTGVYVVTGTDDSTGCSNEASVEVVVNDLPIVEATADDVEICLGESVTLSGGGATTYEWDGGVTDGEAFTPDATGTTTYAVTGTDDNGCVNTATIDVTVYDAIEITYSTEDELYGDDGSIDITVTGGNPAYSFDWDNDGIGDFDDAEDLTGLAGGTYIVAVEDEAGCTAGAEIIVESQLNIEDYLNTVAAVYPNPTVDQLTIILSGTFHYSLFNASGRLVLQGNGNMQEVISLNNEPNGIYYLNIVQNNDLPQIIKVVKN